MYKCSYDIRTGYDEILDSHIVEVEFNNLGMGLHNVTVDLFTFERLRFVNPICSTEEPVVVSCENGRITINLKTRTDWCRILIGLNETKDYMDPLDVFGSPYVNNMYLIDRRGKVNLPFWLNSSQFMSYATFDFQPRGNVEIEELDVQTGLEVEVFERPYSGDAWFSIANASIGDREITADILFNSASGSFDLEVRASSDQIQMPIECYINGTLCSSNKHGIATYTFDEFKFSIANEPLCYYGEESSYCLKFNAPKKFVLRIDAKNREEIDYLLLDPMPQNLSIEPATFRNEPCYQFTFEAASNFNVCLGLTLRSKSWFLNPLDMSLDAIPEGIKKKYLSSEFSIDGDFFDLGNNLVEQWAEQVVSSETNPFIIAELIFKNITTTLEYPPDWRALDEKHAFNESVSKILLDRKGVCRHFARTYAAFCITSGLPARTVIGTAFSFLNETYKKNHEWTEIYLPGAGWVTVDSAWKQFFILCDKHAKSTWWTYLNESLNVSKYDDPAWVVAKSCESKNLMQHLIELIRKKIPRNHSSSDSVELVLDKAVSSAGFGQIHDALVLSAKASLLVSALQTSFVPSLSIHLVVILLLGAMVLVAAWIIGQREIEPSLLVDYSSLHSFSTEDKNRRELEYDTLNRIVISRERSTLTIGSILSSACFLMLSIAFRTNLIEMKFLIVLAAVALEGIWLCYYLATGKLDYVCYDLLRKLEKTRRISVHRYLYKIREKVWSIKARRYIWLAIFITVWMLGTATLF